MGNILPIKHLLLECPPLKELEDVIQHGLEKAFREVIVDVRMCPDLRQPPFHLAAPGLCGSERIADVGGPPYLQPVSDLSKKYGLPAILKMLGMQGQQAFAIGAAGGPFHVIGQNSELVPNIACDAQQDSWQVLTRYVKIDQNGNSHCDTVPNDTKDFGLMANLFVSQGCPGRILHIVAKGRLGQLNFPESIQSVLRAHYGNRPVSLGGVFLIRRGKAKLHVMTDFSKEPCPGPDHQWFKYYEVDSPIICLTVFHSVDSEGWDLRMEHTHCFSDNGVGGHYHYDTHPRGSRI
ncbi:hypothetical protein BJX65DRAFT_312995 [Aspergillus insuetus]